MKLKKLICCLPVLWAPHLLALDIIDHAELVTALTYGYATYEEGSLTRELELRPAIELSADR